MFVKKIGIDLGTSNSLVFVPKKGVILEEPSVVAVTIPENRILAVGKEAKEMTGRTPDNIRVYRPLKEGVIADFRVTQAMIKHFISKAVGRFQFFKPELLIGAPAGITSTEKRAIIEAALKSGAKAAYLAKEPILAAIGAEIPINSSSGHMIVDIGGGTTEVAVISLGGIVTSQSVRVAGDKMNLSIINYIKKKHNLAIGEQTAEEVKIRIGTAVLDKEKDIKVSNIRGRDLISGLPRNIEVTSNEICEALSDALGEVIQAIKMVLRDTPPELSADIMDKGIVLSGGSALLRNIDERIARSIGVPCFLAPEPMLCVVKGAGIVLDNLDLYKKTIMRKK